MVKKQKNYFFPTKKGDVLFQMIMGNLIVASLQHCIRQTWWINKELEHEKYSQFIMSLPTSYV